MILASRQTSRSWRVPSAAVSRHDGQRIDLDQVRVVGLHRGVEPLGDGHELVQQGIAQADGQAQAPGLKGEQTEQRIGGYSVDGARILPGDFLDLHAALGRGHQHDPAAGTVDDGAEVELLDDLGGRCRRGLCVR